MLLARADEVIELGCYLLRRVGRELTRYDVSLRCKVMSGLGATADIAQRCGLDASVAFDRYCSLIPGLVVKLSTIILAGLTVLSAVGARPPHDGIRRRWWINVASAVALSGARKESDDLTTATVPAGTTFPAVSREPCDLLMSATRQPFSSTS